MKVIVNIDVPDLRPAIEFYCAALGVEHTRTLDDDTAELSGGASTFYLLRKAGGTQAVRDPVIHRDYQRHWTPVHFDLVVPDVEAAAARALAAGAKQESGSREWRGSRWISLSDPFGHGFCFIQFEKDGTYRWQIWRTVGRSIDPRSARTPEPPCLELQRVEEGQHLVLLCLAEGVVGGFRGRRLVGVTRDRFLLGE